MENTTVTKEFLHYKLIHERDILKAGGEALGVTGT
jgi:hypothetical protein